MKQSTTLFLLAMSFFLFCSCNSGEESTQSMEQDEVRVDELPRLPVEMVETLSTRCDNIQYIFIEYPVSFSQSDVGSVRQTLNFIQEETALVPASCRPTADMIFLGEGEILADAKLYFMDDCSYIVFEENGTPTYSHKLSEEGKSFYMGVLENYYDQLQQQQRQR